MTVYLIAEILALALAYPLCIYKPNRVKNVVYVSVLFLYLWILSTLRYDVGNDYFSYIQIFYDAKGLTWAECFDYKIEAGYMLLNKVIALFSSDYRVMHSVMAFLCIAPVGYMVAKYSKNVWLSCHLYLCLTLYYSSMNFIRQTLAATVVFLGYRWFRDRKTVPFLVLVLVASTVHSSALIMVPIYLLIAYVKPTMKVLSVSMVLLLLLYVFSNDILQVVTEVFPKYSSYLDTKYIKVGLQYTYTVVPALYMLLMLFGYYECGYDRERYQSILTSSSVVYFGIWFFITKHFILERFSIFLNCFILLAIPDVMETIKYYFIGDGLSKSGKVKYSVLTLVVVLVTFWYNLYGMVKGFHGVFPYQSFVW